MTQIKGGELVCPKCHSRWVTRFFPMSGASGVYECMTCKHHFSRGEGIKASYDAAAGKKPQEGNAS